MTGRRCSLRVAASLVVASSLGGCGLLYGADFGYPSAPAAPDGARVLVTARAADDDDPMRGRVLVLDLGGAEAAEVGSSYREAYPADDGWIDLRLTSGDQRLCLVRRTDEGWTDYVEVFRYRGSRVEAQPDRVLVMRSRIANVTPDTERRTCGLATGWVSPDLL